MRFACALPTIPRAATSLADLLRIFNLSSQFPLRNVKIVTGRLALPYRLLFPERQWYTS